MVEYLEAFDILHKARSFSEAGPNPIGIPDIWALIQLKGASDTDEMLDFIRIMDDTYLKLYQSKRQMKLEAEKKKNGRRK